MRDKLIIALLVLITLNSLNLYIKSKKELNQEISYFREFFIKANELIALKKRKIYLRRCFKNGAYKCTLNKKELYKISNLLSKSEFKKFSIKEKNNKIDFFMELR
jgi:hypothetical protein